MDVIRKKEGEYMADEIVEPVQGADDQSPATPADQGGQDDNQVLRLDNQTPEEVEFNGLSGSAQERVRELVKRAKDAEDKAYNQTYVPPAPVVPESPDVRDAVRKLSEVGIATNESVNKTVDEKLNLIRWENEMNRLNQTYSGEEGKPQFVREEVEDYIRTHPQFAYYAPEDVFKFKMFPDEFAGAQAPASKGGQTLKPTRQPNPQPAMTVEYIAERTDSAKYPDAREWQDEHKKEIDKVLSQMG